jgi:magnesium chelatase subunit D
MSDSALIAGLLALDRGRLGGVIINADHASDWLNSFRILLELDGHLRDIPASVSDERLLGAVDIASTLAAGKPVYEPGLLQQRGTFILRGAERISTERASVFSAAIDSVQSSMIACESAIDGEEQVPSKLTERLAFRIDEAEAALFMREDITAARQRLQTLQCTDDQITAICHTALALGITSPRAPLMAVATACGLAALSAQTSVSEDDTALACRLVLVHRATRFPQQEDEQPEEPEQDPKPENDTPDETTQQDPTPQEMQEVILEAIKSSLPSNLLASLQSAEGRLSAGRNARGDLGRKTKAKRGRSIGSKRGSPTRGLRLDLIATLRAAVLFQPFRKKFAARDGLIVTRDDFRVKRIKQRSETTAIFVVDASGSAALQRLGEAKGAVELILADCYVRRDKASLIAFRGKTAEQLLPPTRSLERAKRALAGLPGGGGTPIALGLDLSLNTALQVRRAGGRPIIILLTDGRANVTRTGEGNRSRATEEAMSAARALGSLNIQSLMIDVSPDPRAAARDLANAMDATYMALPRAGSAAIAAPVAAALRQSRT